MANNTTSSLARTGVTRYHRPERDDIENRYQAQMQEERVAIGEEFPAFGMQP
jgi:hypothetical protein